MAAMGVDEVRLTGGEPLVRRDLPVLVGMLAPLVDDLSLTTNGVLLDRLAGPLVEAGLRRLNVSLDSLSHVRFAEITRRDALDRVLAGLEEAERYPELRPIKVNCVAIRGFTEEEVPALAELARRKPYVVRFIEFMPLDAEDRKSTRLNSSHLGISYAVFCLKKKTDNNGCKPTNCRICHSITH